MCICVRICVHMCASVRGVGGGGSFTWLNPVRIVMRHKKDSDSRRKSAVLTRIHSVRNMLISAKVIFFFTRRSFGNGSGISNTYSSVKAYLKGHRMRSKCWWQCRLRSCSWAAGGMGLTCPSRRGRRRGNGTSLRSCRQPPGQHTYRPGSGPPGWISGGFSRREWTGR